jgi:hypothetical protein
MKRRDGLVSDTKKRMMKMMSDDEYIDGLLIEYVIIFNIKSSFLFIIVNFKKQPRRASVVQVYKKDRFLCIIAIVILYNIYAFAAFANRYPQDCRDILSISL